MKKFITAALATVLLAGCSSAGTTDETVGTVNTDTTIEDNGSIENASMEIVRRENEVDAHEVIGTYNEHTILAMDFITGFTQERNSQEEMLRMFGLADEDIADYWAEEQDGVTTMDMFRDYILNRAKEQATMLILAQNNGFSYDPEDLARVDEELRGMMDEVIAMGMNPYQMFYDNNGISIEDFSRIQQNSLTIFAFVQDLMENVEVSREDILAYMEENAEILASSEKVTAGHILLNLDNWDEAEAEAFADELADRLRAGEDVNTLALEYSEDPGVQRPEGAFYTFGRGEMVPEFEAWAFDAQAGDIGVVRTDFGFHVMYSMGAANMEDQVEETLRMTLAEARLNEMMDEANIEWTINEDVVSQIN